ncbi:hypothetical protein GGI42DRAFT_318785 [Trichoderma sp. SZMC 28013]
MMLFAARLTSVASARTGLVHTGSLPCRTYLDGCAGPFSAAHGISAIFFFFSLDVCHQGPISGCHVTAKPRCIGDRQLKRCSWPGLSTARAEQQSFRRCCPCPPSNCMLSPSSIFHLLTWIPFPLSYSLAELALSLSIVRNPPWLAWG